MAGHFRGFNEVVTIDENTSALIIESKLHGRLEVLIDSEDIRRIRMFRWSAARSRGVTYATTHFGNSGTGFSGRIRLHQLITSFEHKIVDHKNRNGLDNRKENLRGCTGQENRANCNYLNKSKSGFIGVSTSNKNKTKRFRSRIMIQGKNIDGGSFETPIEAAKSYDMLALKHYGKFATLNFPKEV